MLLDESLPKVAVHDVVVHEESHDLIVGTHGRSIYKVNVAELQQLGSSISSKPVYVFSTKPATYNNRWGENRWSRWSGVFEPSITMPIFVSTEGSGVLKIYDQEGNFLAEQNVDLLKGLNYLDYDMHIDQDKLAGYEKALKKTKIDYGDKLTTRSNGLSYLMPGSYKIELTMGTAKGSGSFKIKVPRERPSRKPQKKIP